jgi:hypothetical protein
VLTGIGAVTFSGKAMREIKKDLMEQGPELMLHRAAVTPAYPCCDYRMLVKDRLRDNDGSRCLRNEISSLCVAPPRKRNRRITA